jgi:formylglycine-generating enzyme required for sulfatase activity
MSVSLPQGKGGTIKPAPTTAPVVKKTTAPKKSASSARTTRSSSSNSGNASSTEIAFWSSIKDSTDPEDFRAYLNQYPNGKFAALAKNRLKTLEASQPKPVATPAAAKETTPANTSGTNATPGNTSGSSSTAPTVTPLVDGAKPAPKPGTVVKNSIGMELVYVPAGSFMMGSENGRSNEKPVHQVTIKEGFYMGRYEVTQAQWKAVVGNNPSIIKGDNLPVGEVSWDDTQEFIRRMNALSDSYTYRLPSEAEWEYACRAGTTGDYAGNLDSMAWYTKTKSGRGSFEEPVGQKQPNAFGLYDMHGNMDEWCQDKYHENYNGALTDGSAWQSVGSLESVGDFRVHRGGSYLNNIQDLRSASRTAHDRSVRFDSIGFRVVALARTQ